MTTEVAITPEPSPPTWFIEALRTPYRSRHVISDGCAIEYHQWGKAEHPLLLLVHGNGGHANWWDFIAPALAGDFCVCAIHLAGMGNSGYRHEYDFDSYARDLIAVAKDAGYSRGITLVGHSMGGIISMRAAENYPEQIKALVIIDSPLIFRRSDDAAEQHKPILPTRIEFKSKKFYADATTALSRYHLIPTQPCANTFLVRHVAQHSIRQYAEGWSWKFDEGIYSNFKRTLRPPFDMEKIHCPLAYIYGGQSTLVPKSVVADIHLLLKNKGPIVEIPEAHHHIMLDEPLQLITRIKDCLETFG